MTDTQHVMLDIETLGTDPGSVILSIGAVTFTTDGVGDNEFSVTIDVDSSTDAGLHIDVGTLEWWLGQDDAALLTDAMDGTELRDALQQYRDWHGEQNPYTVWANSPAFDCVLLEAAYDAVDLPPPWTYYDRRCHRTLTSLVDVDEPEFEGTEHVALDDARHQARVASRALDSLGTE